MVTGRELRGRTLAQHVRESVQFLLKGQHGCMGGRLYGQTDRQKCKVM